jgi:histone arginine demethylase JMJD6
MDYMYNNRDDSPLYLFESSWDSASMEKIRTQYSAPLNFFPHDFLNLAGVKKKPPYRWFCIGPARSGTTVHKDPLNTSAWNAVISGTKKWVCFPPEIDKKVAKGKPFMKDGEDDEAIHYFDFVLPRIRKQYPDMKIYSGLQGPGELIFVPYAWWHGVVNLDNCVAVTQNYCGYDNFDAVWRSVRKERPRLCARWARAMQLHAPELHRRAGDLNRMDDFSDGDYSSSSSTTSSSSSTFSAEDIDWTGLDFNSTPVPWLSGSDGFVIHDTSTCASTADTLQDVEMNGV